MSEKPLRAATSLALVVLAVTCAGCSDGGGKPWWVWGVAVSEMGTGFKIELGIASKDNALIESLGDDMWEVKPGPECSETVLCLTFPSSVNAEKDECSDPHRRLKLAVAPKKRGESLSIHSALETAIRVKGESDWVKLSEVIEVGEDGETYELKK